MVEIGIKRYEMIGEAQPEMKLLEVVVFIYPFFLKVGSSRGGKCGGVGGKISPG